MVTHHADDLLHLHVGVDLHGLGVVEHGTNVRIVTVQQIIVQNLQVTPL